MIYMTIITTIPSIDIIRDFLCLIWRVISIEVLVNPCNEVVLECAFNDLMKDIWRDEFIYVGSRKIFSKGLGKYKEKYLNARYI